jgi:hypothetical protein
MSDENPEIQEAFLDAQEAVLNDRPLPPLRFNIPKKDLVSSTAVMVRNACDEVAEDLCFAVSMVVVPDQQGQPQPMMAIYLAMDSGFLGAASKVPLMAMAPMHVEEDEITSLVLQMAEQMRQQRSEMVSQAMAQGSGMLRPNG